MMFYKDKCTHCGKCIEVCPNSLKCDFCAGASCIALRMLENLGKDYTVDEVFEEIIKDKAFMIIREAESPFGRRMYAAA
ncbi:MAG: 4Fe-4S binding protein [Oscillospiraceae bacterium]